MSMAVVDSLTRKRDSDRHMIEQHLAHDVLADMQAVAEAVDSGEPLDPELAHRVRERARKAREALVQAVGVQDIGVDLIREARDAR